MPEYFHDHKLQQEPWKDYREFQVENDWLVVYYKIDLKKRMRMVTITDHKELSDGNYSIKRMRSSKG